MSSMMEEELEAPALGNSKAKGHFWVTLGSDTLVICITSHSLLRAFTNIFNFYNLPVKLLLAPFERRRH